MGIVKYLVELGIFLLALSTNIFAVIDTSSVSNIDGNTKQIIATLPDESNPAVSKSISSLLNKDSLIITEVMK